MTAEEVGRRMSATELVEWAAFFALEDEEVKRQAKERRSGGRAEAELGME